MKLLIIGGGPTGFSAALSATEITLSRDKLDVTLLAKSSTVGYCLGALPLLFGKNIRIQDTLSGSKKILEDRGVQVHTQIEVTNVNPRSRFAVANEHKFEYDKLILAVGSGKRERVEIKGSNLPHVFELSSFEDGLRVQKQLERANNLVIIGTGFVGTEIACLASQNYHVCVVDASPFMRIPGYVVDQDMTKKFSEQLRNAGVQLRLNVNLNEMEILDKKVLIEREKIPADIIIDALGGEKEDALRIVRHTGIEFGTTDLVKVNKKMETSIPGIYAAGTCSEYIDHLGFATPSLGEPVAWIQGKVAGANAAGAKMSVHPLVMPGVLISNNFQFGYAGLASVELAKKRGFSPAVAEKMSLTRAEFYPDTKNIFVRIIADKETRKILGGAFIGQEDVKERVNILEFALKKCATIDDLENYEGAFLPNVSVCPDPITVVADSLREIIEQ